MMKRRIAPVAAMAATSLMPLFCAAAATAPGGAEQPAGPRVPMDHSLASAPPQTGFAAAGAPREGMGPHESQGAGAPDRIAPGRALAQAVAADQAEQVSPDVDRAYAEIRAGNDEAASRLFARADASGQLPLRVLQDAGFAAQRAGHDEAARAYFVRAIEAANAGKLSIPAQSLFDARRTVADLSRRWGAIASLTYRRGGGVVPRFGAAEGAVGTKTLQARAEVYWRPLGYQGGRHIELFARGFETLDSEQGPTGRDSAQTAVGIRWKPLRQHNLVLSLARTDSEQAGGDWLAQAAWSLDLGTDLRVDTREWPTTRVWAETGRYTRSGQSFAAATVQAGRTYCVARTPACLPVFPHVVLASEYDTAYARNGAVGAGVGVGLRHWFRETANTAPESYVDLLLQYRVRLAGDRRIGGLFFSAVFLY